MNIMNIILPLAGCFALTLCMIDFYSKRHFIKYAANRTFCRFVLIIILYHILLFVKISIRKKNNLTKEPDPACAKSCISVDSSNLDRNVLSPLDGELIKYAVGEGTYVEKNDVIVLMQASNIKIEIRAHCAGKIHFLCMPGSYIEKNTVIAQILEN